HVVYDRHVRDPAKAPRSPRSESREIVELRAIRELHPELADAVDMHIELLELHRRVQGRVPLPWLELNAEVFGSHQQSGRPLLRFEDIRIEPSDLRLLFRQIADVLRRYGALEDADCQRIQAIGRDMNLIDVARRWYSRGMERHAVAAVGVAFP